MRLHDALDMRPRDLCDLETRGPWAVASRAQQGRYLGPEGF